MSDLRAMQQAADRTDALRLLVRWLARRIDASVALLDQHGRPLHAFPRFPYALASGARADITRVRTGRADSAVLDLDRHVLHVLGVHDDPPGPVLLVSTVGRLPVGASDLVGDALRLMRLRWRLESAEGRRRAVETADRRTREAVLHLLMTGDIESARRVAAALRPELPDPLRVHVVECGADDRDDVAGACASACGDTAWVIRCPVYERHLIVLAPAAIGPDPAAGPGTRPPLRRLAEARGDLRVGESTSVPLHDIGPGYEEAFHALAAAGDTPYAVFDPRADLALVLGDDGHAWASALLAPLLEFVPERRRDPAGRDLLVTLRSWLDFHGRAAAQLKLHRNTVAARLRRVEGLLGCGLADLAAQARAHLAMRVLATRPRAGCAPDGAPPSLEELLATPQVRRWADAILAPVLEHDARTLLHTLRVWLGCDTRLEDAAGELGISVPGARKRLLRLEQRLGRSLLRGPSARYDLLFAVCAHDRHPVGAAGAR